MEKYFYGLKGHPIGFIKAETVYDLYGRALGWVDGLSVYGKTGTFVGRLYVVGENHYILKFILDLQPLPLQPREIPNLSPEDFEFRHVEDIDPIEVPPGYVDSF
jgi:hypothetical protein